MKIHVRDGDLHLLDLRTRMPFRYGIATMTRTPHVFVRLRVEVDGKPAGGVAADHLPPKWFTKDPARPVAEEIDEMVGVIVHALRTAPGLKGDSPFDAWRQLFDAQDGWGRAQGLPPLLTHFGPSLVERALIEAVCRAVGQPLAQVLAGNGFGMCLGDIHPPLAGLAPADLLPQRPRSHIIARHTVGLADPLVDSDIPPGERLDDGLPQSLAACIQTYGLRQFKIKISGDGPRDHDRLARLAEVIAEHAPADFGFTLDGNEQFHGVAEFRAFWDGLSANPRLQGFFRHLRFVEQPLHRDVALLPGVGEQFAAWPARPRIIIDESDGELDSLPQALALGYAGTSHKNCKGVFKGIANGCLVARLEREHRERSYLLSGEDLANIGPVALLQDLAVCAALGIASVERNGHHYFAGLSMFPAAIQEQVLQAHGDLYHRSRDGWPTLTIRDGVVQLQSVNAAPLGVGFELDVDQFPSRAVPGNEENRT
jgi:L-alanine-DL-glutamate epimerase-like enolase superfamily enzyme